MFKKITFMKNNRQILLIINENIHNLEFKLQNLIILQKIEIYQYFFWK